MLFLFYLLFLFYVRYLFILLDSPEVEEDPWHVHLELEIESYVRGQIGAELPSLVGGTYRVEYCR